MDAQGHVNNARVVSYLEQARVAAFYDPLAIGGGRGQVVSRHVIDYISPIVYQHAPLHIELWVSKIAAASFIVHSEISFEGALAVRADTTMVSIDLTTGRPSRLTAAYREMLATFRDEAALDEPAPA